jgi:REP element-mobilizing transposase RayT
MTEIIAASFNPWKRFYNPLQITADNERFMPGTLAQMYVQTVFAVKYRKALIAPEWEPKLHAVISILIAEAGGKPYIVNGIADHIHCFFGIRPSHNVSDIMQVAKAKASKWLNEEIFVEEQKFAWQEGFGCFTYGHSQRQQVYHYVANQKRHHEHQKFLEEYVQMLDVFGIEYDPKFIFHEPME